METDPWLYALHFLHDTARVLALARRQPLTRNPQGHLQPEAVTRLITQCRLTTAIPTTFSEAQAPPLSFLVHLLTRAGWLTADAAGALICSPAALTGLQTPLPLALAHLREVWWRDLLPDMSALPPLRLPATYTRRWRNLTLTACAAIAALPSDRVIPLSQLAASLDARHYLTPPGDAAHLPTVQTAYRRQALQLLEFVTTVALRALGLVSYTAAPQPALQLLPGAAEWLRAALAQRALWDAPPADAAVELGLPAIGVALPRPTAPPLTFTPDLGFTLSPYAALELTFAAQHFAVPALPTPPAGASAPDRYTLTRASLAAGVAWGYPVAEVLLRLGHYSGGELDAAAWAQFQAWQQEIQTVPCEAGYRLHFEPAVLQHLHQRPPFRQRTTRGYGQDTVWVAQSEAAALFRYLRRLGYTLPVPAAAPPPLPQGLLPLAPLLTALHTYQALRAHLRGLAALPLADFIHTLEQALPAADREAVAHLVAAQRAALDRALADEGASLGWDEGERQEIRSKKQETRNENQESDNDLPASNNEQPAASLPLASCLLLTYVDAQARRTQRRVWPVRLEQRGGLTYLVARCELRGAERHFRLDRILAAAPVTE